VAVVALGTPVRAQETPKPDTGKATDAATPRPKKVPTLLRAQIVIARYQGERKVASVPYTVLLTADEQKTLLRMGVEVPIAVLSYAKTDDGKSSPSTSFQYRNVGTNIDCWASERSSDGIYLLRLNVESSSVYTAAENRTAGGLSEGGNVPDRPLFRTFNVSLYPVLRDSQSIQAVASTDPVTGEVVKIDVTLNVVK
jgi:hypothetical protein